MSSKLKNKKAEIFWKLPYPLVKSLHLVDKSTLYRLYYFSYFKDEVLPLSNINPILIIEKEIAYLKSQSWVCEFVFLLPPTFYYLDCHSISYLPSPTLLSELELLYYLFFHNSEINHESFKMSFTFQISDTPICVSLFIRNIA